MYWKKACYNVLNPEGRTLWWFRTFIANVLNQLFFKTEISPETEKTDSDTREEKQTRDAGHKGGENKTRETMVLIQKNF